MAAFDFSGLTCVIPTHQRSRFLRRQLHHIAACDAFPKVIVVDSSGPVEAEANRNAIHASGIAEIEYQHYDLPFFDKLTTALASATSPFVVICADDDTFAPRGLQACLDVMRSDARWGAAIGRCYVLNTGEQTLVRARGYALEAADPLQRMRLYLDNWFSNYYAVHRREVLIDQLQLGQRVIDPVRSRLLNELLDSLLAVLAAPMAYVDVDYLCYQIHDGNLSKNSQAIADPSEFETLVEQTERALLEYLRGCHPNRGDERDGWRLERMLRRYLSSQRIPGRKRSRRRRMTRELQKTVRRWTGARHGAGMLEPRRLGADLALVPDEALRRGMESSRQYPEGLPDGEHVRQSSAA